MDKTAEIHENFILEGTDTAHIARIQQKRDREQRKILKQQERKRNREARENEKVLKRLKEAKRYEKPIYVRTVKHQPTYCSYSHKRIADSNDPKFNTVNFNSPPAFVSKSEIQSFKSQSRLKNAIGWLLLFADLKRIYCKSETFNKKTGQVIINKKTGKPQHNFFFRLAFITLTIPYPQLHDDEYVKEHMLQPFLYWLNRYYNSLYVWKAESQLNGDIHFHITVDTFVPWKSIRAKWNQILSKHGYCKVFQDGTNDKGNASTQVKAVRNEAQCARDIGGYLSDKDRVKKKDYKRMNDDAEALETAVVHCKFDPDIKDVKKQDKRWYKRTIEGRLWGCSSKSYQTKDGKFVVDQDGKKQIAKLGLTDINIFIDETDRFFEKEEKIFFRQNPDIYNLGKKVIEREKLRYSKMDDSERSVIGQTDEMIEHRYRFMQNVFVHKHLSLMKMGGELQRMIHDQKLARQKNFQKFFTIDTLN